MPSLFKKQLSPAATCWKGRRHGICSCPARASSTLNYAPSLLKSMRQAQGKEKGRGERPHHRHHDYCIIIIIIIITMTLNASMNRKMPRGHRTPNHNPNISQPQKMPKGGTIQQSTVYVYSYQSTPTRPSRSNQIPQAKAATAHSMHFIHAN